MLPQNKPDRIRILFDDHRLVANAGLLLPATLARHLGLRELVDHHLDLGGAPGRANTGDKMLTLVASALAGGDCIDDADASCWLGRWGRTRNDPSAGRLRLGMGRHSIGDGRLHGSLCGRRHERRARYLRTGVSGLYNFGLVPSRRRLPPANDRFPRGPPPGSRSFNCRCTRVSPRKSHHQSSLS